MRGLAGIEMAWRWILIGPVRLIEGVALHQQTQRQSPVGHAALIPFIPLRIYNDMLCATGT